MISFPHKVIFIHIPKCGGQSVERAFLRDLGFDWSNRHSLLLRPKENHESGPKRLAHLYANEYVGLGYISKQDFNNFHKFTIVRDPIDRIISELNFRRIRKGVFGVNSIEEYVVKIRRKYDVNSDLVRHLEPQVNFIFDSKMESIMVDDIMRLENIEVGFSGLRTLMNCGNLQIKKENISKKRIWIKSEISQNDLAFIREIYARDFEFLASLPPTLPC